MHLERRQLVVDPQLVLLGMVAQMSLWLAQPDAGDLTKIETKPVLRSMGGTVSWSDGASGGAGSCTHRRLFETAGLEPLLHVIQALGRTHTEYEL